MIRWDHDKEVELFDIVNGEVDITEGLHRAAELMDTSFFVVRNRWYHPNLKAMRGVTVRTPVTPVATAMTMQTGNVQVAVQLLHEAIEFEAQELRKEIEGLRSTNNNLMQTHESLQDKFNELLEEYTAIHRVIAIAREISVKEQLGEKPESRFKMERNGNLESIV